MMTTDEVEAFAIRAAKGNNGGEWATHYTEEQKEHWRAFVRDLARSVADVYARMAVECLADHSRPLPPGLARLLNSFIIEAMRQPND